MRTDKITDDVTAPGASGAAGDMPLLSRMSKASSNGAAAAEARGGFAPRRSSQYGGSGIFWLCLVICAVMAALWWRQDVADRAERAERSQQAAFSLASIAASTLADQLQRSFSGNSANWDGDALRRLASEGRLATQPGLRWAGTDLVVVAADEQALAGSALQGDAAQVARQVLADGRARVSQAADPAADATVHQVVAPLRVGDRVMGVLLLDYCDSSAPAARPTIAGAALALLPLLLAPMALAVVRRRAAPGAWYMGWLGRLAPNVATQGVREQIDHEVAVRTVVLRKSAAGLSAALSDRDRTVQHLVHQSRFDALTGLPHRESFIQRLEHALALSRRHGHKLALLLIDLDRFRSINESLGHEVGDAVLRGAAQRLRGQLRDCDTVFRISSDEFAVILEEVDAAQGAAVVAEKLLRAFQEPLQMPDGSQVYVTLSMGIAMAPDDGQDMLELMRHADLAMEHSKASGRNNWQMHSSNLCAQARKRLAIEHGLRRAIERKELELYYQPRVDSVSRRLVGMEVLLRWHSAELGTVPPDLFIPVAEESGTIIEIGRWVLHTAFEQLAHWRRAGLVSGVMAVNVSALQLRGKEFVQQVVEAAQKAGVMPCHVELELTETMLVDDPEGAAMMLSALRGHGFGVAIDDFGKGHSSLTHLKQFPATKLKIDRAFIAEIDRNPVDRAIAASIVALGRALDFRVTAEGVETERQLEVLDSLGCHEYQGYFFGRPMPRDEMQALLGTPCLRAA